MEFQAIVVNVIVMGALGQRGSLVDTLYSLSLRDTCIFVGIR